ncbi:MAG: hypothetical protein JWO06_3271 [Bacteroidota bacterium]|nr:hypothetical protein [Bacteroidota bacterium]
MKKIFMVLSATCTLTAALILGSCGNDADVQKQTDEQNAKIQAAVDSKLSGLSDQVNKECAATVDSLSIVQFEAWKEEEKGQHHGGTKPKPKPTPKKEEPKPQTVGNGKPKMGGENGDPNTIGNGKPKMGGSTGSTGTVGNGKPKMGGGPK